MLFQKSPVKKTVFLLLITAGLFLANINLAEAVAWKTITDIPGLPAGTEASLDDFIIVIYDFLLSAVGIAAMLMIVIGGFRYLTAAGNAAALSEAKDIIYSALYGLLLAISVWVIVSTINPDLVYLKKPGASPTSGDYSCLPSGSACVAGDNCCYGVCTGAKCPEKPNSCVDPTWPLDGDGEGNCKCINGHTINKGGATDCDDACFNDYGWGMPSCVRFRVLVGFESDKNYLSFEINPEQQYSISVDEKLYYKITIDDPRGIMASVPANSMDCDSNGSLESAFCFKLNCDMSNDAGDPAAVPPIPPRVNEWEIATNSFSGMAGQGLNNQSFSYTYTNPLLAITNTAHYVASWSDPKCPMNLCYDSRDFWFKVEN